jgi:hypothetical protein
MRGLAPGRGLPAPAPPVAIPTPRSTILQEGVFEPRFCTLIMEYGPREVSGLYLACAVTVIQVRHIYTATKLIVLQYLDIFRFVRLGAFP